MYLPLIKLSAALVALCALSACAVSPPAQAPQTPEPSAIVDDGNFVTHVSVRTIAWDRVAFRRWLEREQLVSFFPKDMGIAGVKSTTPMRGVWGQNNAIRRVELTDGHYAFDLILNNRYPDVLQYQVFGLTNDLGRVAEYVRAELKYTEDRPGVTTLQWTYAVRPKSVLTKPLLSNAVKNRVAPCMEAEMTNMAAAAAVAASGAAAQPK